MPSLPQSDLTGQRFTKWTVIKYSHTDRNGAKMWLCQCDCGKVRPVNVYNLTKGTSRCCGCIGNDKVIQRNYKHGLTGSPEYETWLRMRNRVYCKTSEDYPYYGGRGITICDQWSDPQVFVNDMGLKPTDSHTIERRDNSKGYNPENCYWGTRLQQSQNTRTNVNFTINGETKCISEWCRIFNRCRKTVSLRLNRGWSITDALQ